METVEGDGEDELPDVLNSDQHGRQRRSSEVTGNIRQLLLTVVSNQQALRRAQTEQSNMMDAFRSDLRVTRRDITRLVHKIDRNPLKMMQRVNGNGQAAASSPHRNQVDDHASDNAFLEPRVITINALWTEWNQGIGRNKPARYFTRAEVLSSKSSVDNDGVSCQSRRDSDKRDRQDISPLRP